MAYFRLTSKTATHAEIKAWLDERNVKYHIRVMVVIVFGGSNYDEYDVTLDDEMVAIEFRLAFDAIIGKRTSSLIDIEDEMNAALNWQPEQ